MAKCLLSSKSGHAEMNRKLTYQDNLELTGGTIVLENVDISAVAMACSGCREVVLGYVVSIAGIGNFCCEKCSKSFIAGMKRGRK
jgi:hypothetical protein